MCQFRIWPKYTCSQCKKGFSHDPWAWLRTTVLCSARCYEDHLRKVNGGVYDETETAPKKAERAGTP